MERITFNSIDELYNRLKPAFRFKINELNSKGITYISAKDIWLYLSKNKWSKEKNLELCDMVNDILNLDDNKLIGFINSK